MKTIARFLVIAGIIAIVLSGAAAPLAATLTPGVTDAPQGTIYISEPDSLTTASPPLPPPIPIPEPPVPPKT